MAKQVQFYSVDAASYSALTSKDAGGIYFVDGGELYKGTSRFGANKVWTSKPASNAGVIGGDMYISNGVAEVFNGSEWVGIANANKWTAKSYGGEGSYIQAVSQAADGTVTATAVAFPTLDTGENDGEVKLGSDAAKVAGWDTLVGSVSTNATNIANVSSALGSLSTTVASVSSRVGTLETKVSGIENIVDTANGGTVTASSGVFTNLTVSDTATFSATTVSATSLTVNGSTVEQLADKQIGAATLTGAISSSEGTKLVNEGQVVNYVSAQLSSFDNAMHFREVVASTGAISDPAKGDIVVIGATPASGFTQGQEYIYDGTKWELIGDQKTYAVESVVSASVTALQNRATALETSMATRASVGTGTADASYGVSGEVVLAANAEPTLSISVAPVTTSTGITDQATTSLVTAAAIKAYVDGAIADIPRPNNSTKGDTDKGVQVSVTTEEGVVTSVDVVTTLDTDIGPSSGTGAATDNEIPSSLAVRKAIDDAALVWKNASGQVIA